MHITFARAYNILEKNCFHLDFFNTLKKGGFLSRHYCVLYILCISRSIHISLFPINQLYLYYHKQQLLARHPRFDPPPTPTLKVIFSLKNFSCVTLPGKVGVCLAVFFLLIAKISSLDFYQVKNSIFIPQNILPVLKDLHCE